MSPHTRHTIIFWALVCTTAIFFYVVGYHEGQEEACDKTCSPAEGRLPRVDQCLCDGPGNTVYGGW